jgi:hypothetical protein
VGSAVAFPAPLSNQISKDEAARKFEPPFYFPLRVPAAGNPKISNFRFEIWSQGIEDEEKIVEDQELRFKGKDFDSRINCQNNKFHI